MKRPMIGVIPLYDRERSSNWMLPGYLEGLMEAGAFPVMLPLTKDRALLKQIAEQCSAFLFTGGQDVAPALYQEEMLPCCGEICPARDEMELALLPLVLERDKPLLGICRGIQVLNVALGGTLYQDLPTQRPSEVEHHQMPPYDKPVHQVALAEHEPLSQLLEKEELSVNSYHHQAVKTLSPDFQKMAISEDGLIEGIYMPSRKFIMGVQWHPEFSYEVDENSRKIIHAFVRSI